MLNTPPTYKAAGLIFFNHPFKITIKYFPAIKEYFSLPGWFCNKTFFITFPLLHTLEAIILSMQKKYPTNFLIRWIFQNMTRIARKIHSLSYRPASDFICWRTFFRTTFTGAAFFLSALPPLPGATMPRNAAPAYVWLDQ